MAAPEKRRVLRLLVIRAILLVLQNYYFRVGDDLYQQIKGLPVSRTLSLILAILYIVAWEQAAKRIVFGANPFWPLIWKRYMDDVFVIWPWSKGDLNAFASTINSVWPSVQWELGCQVPLPVFDMCITIESSHVPQSPPPNLTSP